MKKKTILFSILLIIAIGAGLVLVEYSSLLKKSSYTGIIEIDFQNEDAIKNQLLGYLKRVFGSTYKIENIDIKKESFATYNDFSSGTFLVRISLLLLEDIQEHPVEKAVLSIKNQYLSDFQKRFINNYESILISFLEEYRKFSHDIYIRFKINATQNKLEYFFETPQAKVFIKGDESLLLKSKEQIYNESLTSLSNLINSISEKELETVEYKPNKAIQYALSYTSNTDKSCCDGDPTYQDVSFYNRDYDYYEGSDCANFVSQAIHAGGIPFDDMFFPYSITWRFVDFEDKNVKDDFFSYILQKYTTLTTSPVIALPGSIALADWNNNNSPDHAMLVTYNDGYFICISSHTSDKKNSILPLGSYALYFLIFR